jgi:hypothetical protein
MKQKQSKDFWRKCPYCGAPAQDNYVTCGNAVCEQIKATKEEIQGISNHISIQNSLNSL